MSDTCTILAFLAKQAEAGLRTALVTVTAVSGSSMRNPGAHLGVSEDGAWSGSLSGGCIEAAVVSEALVAIAEVEPRELRYGTGSRFIDIRLPCGGSIDLLINPIDDPATIRTALDRLEHREPVALRLPRLRGVIGIVASTRYEDITSETGHVTVSHTPPLGLLIVGDGANVTALHDLARTYGADVRVMTTDERIVAATRSGKDEPILLRSIGALPPVVVDRWTAITFLFHDHDWDIALLPTALASEAFYVGAMGSRRTAERRRHALLARGVDPALVARLHAPIGIIHSTRDPEVLALSALAAVVEKFRRVQQAV